MGSSGETFLKAWTIAAGIIIIGLGAASLGVFLKYYKDYKAIPYEKAEEIGKHSVIAISVLTGVFILVGIIGIIGALTKSSCILGIFNIFILIFMLVFIGSGIAAFVLRRYLKDNLYCTEGDLLYDANNAVYDASRVFCTNICPCRVDNQELLQQISQVHSIVTSSTGATRVQDCQNFDQFAGDYSDIIASMEWVENNFQCSGVCVFVNYYMFSDINRGLPKSDCEGEIQDAGVNYSARVAIFCIVTGAFLFICFVFSLILCCKKKGFNQNNNETKAN